jgi:hypothetical protein
MKIPYIRFKCLDKEIQYIDNEIQEKIKGVKKIKDYLLLIILLKRKKMF